jgi:hypothetical protein
MTGTVRRGAYGSARHASCALGLLLAAWVTGAFAQTQPAALSNPLRNLKKEELAGFRERPLFNPARAAPHPPETTMVAPSDAAPPTQDAPPNVHLVGIVSGRQSFATVRQDDGGKTTVLTTGDRLGAWSVTVLPEELRLERDSQTVAINLFSPKSTAVRSDASAPADADSVRPPGELPP